ncbi:hypothetical protein GQ54DRAFT_311712 [Martensiomyces pterosporus]|nr:hypothetical protein GQ54DRAFT_311712 [Martensiomyces pterosporus]
MAHWPPNSPAAAWMLDGVLQSLRTRIVPGNRNADNINAELERLLQREAKSYRYWQDTLVGSRAFVQVKTEPPYSAEQEQQVYLDPLARAEHDPATDTHRFPDTQAPF